MTKVLACLDASPYAVAVCDYAGWAAHRLGQDVELLHVVQRKSAVATRQDWSGAIGLGVESELLEELTRIEEAQGKLAVESGRALLAAATDRLRSMFAVHSESLPRHGGIVETIIEREAHTAMVIMGKRGASSEFAAAHLGSKIERVLRASNKPLLACPQTFTTPAEIVLAYDGGRSSLRALGLLETSKLFDGLSVHILMAGTDDTANHESMAPIVQRFQDLGRTVSFEQAPGTAEHVIRGCMAGRPKALLVMGAYGHSPLRNLIVGSTTTATLRAVNAPILLVR